MSCSKLAVGMDSGRLLVVNITKKKNAFKNTLVYNI